MQFGKHLLFIETHHQYNHTSDLNKVSRAATRFVSKVDKSFKISSTRSRTPSKPVTTVVIKCPIGTKIGVGRATTEKKFTENC